MIRLHIIVEDQTEESFVSKVLAEKLWLSGISATAIIIGKPGHKGGRTSYDRLKRDLTIQLKQDRRSYCTTMLDLYGLGPGYPGTPLPDRLTGLQNAQRIESAIKDDISNHRFIPYLSVHEFEALLFSNPQPSRTL